MPRPPSRRFLAHGAGNGHGYRTQPQRDIPEVADDPETIARIREATSIGDEPEAPGPAIVDAYTDLARTYDRARHAAEVEARQQTRRLLDAEKRLAEAKRQAKLRHIDVSREVHVVKNMLDRARKGGRAEPEAAIHRLERIEARLDHRPDLAA